MAINKQKKAFTIIEVLIFVTLISFIFITAAYLAQLSLLNSSIAKHKIYATQYAEELLEWLRLEKEKSWKNIPEPPTGTTVSYCFNRELSQCVASNMSFASCSVSTDKCGSSYALPPVSNMQYRRYADFTYSSSDDRKTVTIFVYWQERGKDFSVTLNSVLSPYE